MTPAQIFVVLGLVQQYGPSVITAVKILLKKENATIEDVEAIFADLKPYEAFNIPEIIPVPQTAGGPV